MTAEEHLELILTFCRSRLALAEKRTPGAWIVKQRGEHGTGIRIVYRIGEVYRGKDVCGGVAEILEYQSSKEPKDQRNQANAAFIAACAGAAEAGWRATIAAVIAILSSSQTTVHWNAILKPMRDEIIAAYPPELLRPEAPQTGLHRVTKTPKT